MEYVYATLLVNETGQEISEQNLTEVLDAAGGPVQESRIKALVAALEGVDLTDFESVDAGTGIPEVEEPPAGADLDGPEAEQPASETDGVAVETEGVGEMDRTGE